MGSALRIEKSVGASVLYLESRGVAREYTINIDKQIDIFGKIKKLPYILSHLVFIFIYL